MQRIAVAAQGADGEAVIVELLLEFAQRRGVLEHRELAVRVAEVIAGGSSTVWMLRLAIL